MEECGGRYAAIPGMHQTHLLFVDSLDIQVQVAIIVARQ